MPLLGVVGTLVWDRIVPHQGPPVERWGGIGYTLAAASVALPPGWRIRPIVRAGSDLAEGARALLRSIPRVDADAVVTTPESNNRVELRYRDAAERVERLTGGIGPWPEGELKQAVTGCDALLVNFISGYEVALPALRAAVGSFEGLRYADLHSLFLGRAEDGTRVPRRLDDWRDWVACFDAVQVNDVEYRLLCEGPGGASELTDMLAAGARVAIMTRGDEGASIAVRGEGGQVRLHDVTLRRSRAGDPTGCGDVWGGAMASRLVAGDEPRVAAEFANALAAASVEHSGVEGLVEHLSREVEF